MPGSHTFLGFDLLIYMSYLQGHQLLELKCQAEEWKSHLVVPNKGCPVELFDFGHQDSPLLSI
jgi:hypothetical protein